MNLAELQLPHWLIFGGTGLLLIGIVGLLSTRRRREKDTAAVDSES